jgi:hypothetical protein
LERLGRRREGEDGQSDARPEHLPGLVNEFEAIDELTPELLTTINTETEIEANLRTILTGAYSKRRMQVEEIIARL